jgi:hypothetical protein
VSVKPWSGRAVMAARAHMATKLPAPCGQCGKPVQLGSAWVVGHTIAREIRPDLTWEPSNWRHEHRACSNRSGQSVVVEKARLDGARATLEALGMIDVELPGLESVLAPSSFPADTSPRKPPSLPFSPPAATTSSDQLETDPDLDWDVERLAEWWWLRPLLDVPHDASPPRYMSRPEPDAVGSYAWPCYVRKHCPEGAIAWIERVERKTLRWWQKLAIVRQLEHRADGSLVYDEILESASRRSGKSMRVRGVALWRMNFADLFGEVQTVVHTGSDVAICREIQRGAWRWAQESAGWDVSRANGKEALETPHGDRWLVRAQDAVYGYDVCFGVVDEAWDVKPGTVSEGLEPASMERVWPQLHITSTAHTRATSLMRGKLSAALISTPTGTLVLVWSLQLGVAVSDEEAGDERVWREASPHWSESRRKLIAKKYDAALAGQLDPEADDPDPMRGFISQYLNVWRLKGGSGRAAGVQLVEADTFAQLVEIPPTTDGERVAQPAAAALESWFGRGVSLALAWQLEAGRVLVSVLEVADIPAAADVLARTGYRGKLIAGASHVDEPALKRFRPEAGKGRAVNAAHDLERLLGADLFRHDGGAFLAAQVEALRVMPGTDGARLVSKARNDAVKAAMWTADAALTRPAPTGSPIRRRKRSS